MRLRALTDITRTAKKGEEFDVADAAGEILIRDREAEAVKPKAPVKDDKKDDKKGDDKKPGDEK